MQTEGRLLFLGTGGSLGVPVVGCRCHVCRSELPYNKRLRPSALIEMGGKRFVIDCGPDFRSQALTHNIDTLDGIFLTHSHHDHCSGIDELRIFTFKRGSSLPCVMSVETYRDLQRRFHYIFSEEKESPYTSNFSPTLLCGSVGTVDILNWKVSYFSYEQGGMKVNGFRFGDLAFLTDVKHFSDTIFDFLAGIKILVLSALRFTPSPLHLSVDEAIAFAQKTTAKNVWLTHISHEMEHESGNSYLPSNIRLAYDGLSIRFNPSEV